MKEEEEEEEEEEREREREREGTGGQWGTRMTGVKKSFKGQRSPMEYTMKHWGRIATHTEWFSPPTIPV